MKKYLPISLVALALMVTGCPHTEYEVELKPRGNVMERKLTVYRAEDSGVDDAQKRHGLSTNEIAAIQKFYPSGGGGWEEEKFVALGLFAGPMPADIGGAGSYTNLVTSMGSAGFYAERFRGEDDLAAMAQRRAQAADQLTDLLIGWAKAELGKEPKFEDLRKFLDTNVRHDIKNVGEYIAPLWQYESSLKSIAPEGVTNDVWKDFATRQMMRIGQYLVERGYLNNEDIASIVYLSGDGALGPWPPIERLIAAKLGYPAANSIPKSLAFLDDDDAIGASLDKYLETTEFYRTQLSEWDKKKELDSKDDKPKPSEFAAKLAFAAAGVDDFEIFGSNDKLSVNLSLPSGPVESNGKWNETEKIVHWDSELHQKEAKTVLPVFCYASWSQPDEAFQKKHFGNGTLTGRELIRYCLWHSCLNTKQVAEWDALVAALQPGTAAKLKLENFRFSGEPATTNEVAGATLLRSAVGQ